MLNHRATRMSWREYLTVNWQNYLWCDWRLKISFQKTLPVKTLEPSEEENYLLAKTARKKMLWRVICVWRSQWNAPREKKEDIKWKQTIISFQAFFWTRGKTLKTLDHFFLSRRYFHPNYFQQTSRVISIKTGPLVLGLFDFNVFYFFSSYINQQVASTPPPPLGLWRICVTHISISYLCFLTSVSPSFWYPSRSVGLSLQSLLMRFWGLRPIFLGNSITSIPRRIMLYVFIGSEP